MINFMEFYCKARQHDTEFRRDSTELMTKYHKLDKGSNFTSWIMDIK